MNNKNTVRGCTKRSRLFYVLRAAAFLFLPLQLQSCMSYDFSKMDADIRQGDFVSVYERMENDRDDIYRSTDTVLHDLDAGLISHYAGEYERSNAELAAAEQGIYDNYAKSAGQAFASVISNDTAIDYAGDPYEDIYTNIFMALNYIHLGNMEDAFVEIRRFDNKLKTLSVPYQQELAKANMEADSPLREPIPDLEFHNSAFARYLSLLLYRSSGDYAAAEVDRRLIASAFEMQRGLYPFPIPLSIGDEFAVPEGAARLNMIAFTGLSPVKEEKTARLLAPDGSFYYKIAFPEIKLRPSDISSVRVSAAALDGTCAGEIVLEPLESIQHIAADTFRLKQSSLYVKAAVRSLGKAAATAALGYASENDDTGVFSILHLASALMTETTEQADIRASRYFPGLVSVGGLTLEEGVYTVEAAYYGHNGRILERQAFPDVEVSAGELNLVEFICLR